MVVNKRFGELLGQGLRSVANRQRRKQGVIEDEVANHFGGRKQGVVRRWKDGHVPQESIVIYLARYCVQHGFVEREWARSFLHQARCYEKEAVLAELSEVRLSRPEPQHVYQNLPNLHGEVIGREADYARTMRAILSRYPLISIEGIGGVGKTTLAAMVGRACLPGGAANLSQPFEACVFVLARDGLTLPGLCDKIGQVLNYPRVSQSTPPKDKPDEVYKILAQHRVLLIVDNLETVDEDDEALFHFLQDVPEPTKVLLTTRWEQALPSAQIQLEGLKPEPALQLVRNQLAHLGLDDELWATEENCLALVGITAGNPYAIEVSLGYLKYGYLTLPELVNQLFEAGRDVEKIFEYIFQHAWDEVLTETTRSLLLVIPFFVDSVSLAALGASAGVEGYFLNQAVKQLIQMSLLQRAGDKRFSVHPLTRAFSSRQLGNRPGWEQLARQRWLNYWLEFTRLYCGDDWDDWQRFDVAEIEIPNLLLATSWAIETREHSISIELINNLDNLLWIRGFWEENTTLLHNALAMFSQLEQFELKSKWLNRLGWVLTWQGDFEESETYLLRAIELAQRAEDLDRLEHAIHSLGVNYCRWGKYEEGERLLKQALEWAHEIQNNKEILAGWYHLGCLSFTHGDYDAAQEWFHKAKGFGHEIGWARAHAYSRNWLADIEIVRRNYEAAHVLLEEGFPVAENFKDQRRIAFFKKSFATLAYHEGDAETGNRDAREALDLFSRLGMKQEVFELTQLITLWSETELIA